MHVNSLRTEVSDDTTIAQEWAGSLRQARNIFHLLTLTERHGIMRLPVLNARAKMAAIVAGSAILGSAITGTAFAVNQPNMVNARASVRQAISDLQVATPDKGGHRDQAIQLGNQMIQQINQGIRFANTH
jgi:CBS-domain-containing membrane protein